MRLSNLGYGSPTCCYPAGMLTITCRPPVVAFHLVSGLLVFSFLGLLRTGTACQVAGGSVLLSVMFCVLVWQACGAAGSPSVSAACMLGCICRFPLGLQSSGSGRCASGKVHLPVPVVVLRAAEGKIAAGRLAAPWCCYMVWMWMCTHTAPMAVCCCAPP